MRCYQYIKAYRELAESTGEGDPRKYDALKITALTEGEKLGVEIMHVLDDLRHLDVIDERTGAKL